MKDEIKKQNNDEDKLIKFIQQKTSENEALKKLLAELNKGSNRNPKEEKKKKYK